VHLIFSILASYLPRYSYSKIDSLASFTLRVDALRIVYYAESKLPESFTSQSHQKYLFL